MGDASEADTGSTSLPLENRGNGLSNTRGFLVAAWLAVAAAVIRMMLDPIVVDRAPFFTFILAVLVTAYVGGFQHSLAAALLGLIMGWYFFVPPRYSFGATGSAEYIGLILYLIISISIAAFGGMLRAAQRRSRNAESIASGQAGRLHATLQSIADGVITTDANNRITAMNPAAEAMTGWTAAQAAGSPLDEVFRVEGDGGPASNSIPAAMSQRNAAGGSRITILISRTGRRLSIEEIASPIQAPDGGTMGVVLVFRDIGERRKFEEQLRRSEHELAEFFENAAIGMHWIGPDGIILKANQADLDLVGCSREKYVGHHIAEFHADPEVITDILKRLHAGEKLKDHPARLKRGDGSIRDVLIDASVLWERGQFLHTRCFVRDVTHRSEGEIVSRRLAAIVESSDDAIVSKDLKGVIQSWNEGAERIFGYAADEMIGKSVEILIPSELKDEEPRILGRILRGERIEHYETVRVRKDGRRINVSLTISPIRDGYGRIIGASKIARDVTGRKEAAIVSRRLAAIVESSDDAMVGKDLMGIVTSWNRGAERIFGYTAEEMVGKPISILIPSERLDEEPEILARISRGERIEHYETERRRKDGQVINVSLTISPIRDETGTIIGASKVARDITDQVHSQAEREFLLGSERAARTEAERATRLRDEFLAIVSHELRTPLNGILGWAQLLRRSGKDPESLQEGLEAIERGARAQAQLIDDLLDMNRIMTGKLHLDIQSVHLAPVIESALATLRPAAEARDIRIETTLDTNVAPIKGDPTRLQQVVWNLVSNAVKFTPKGGRVQVLLERVNSHVEISVADTGMGIKSEFLPHVFERFRQADSSTSRRFGGLGLGLAIVKQIAELHGGSVAVESAGENKGTIFHVRLPVSIMRRTSQGNAEFVTPAENESETLGGISILIVDDDPGAAEVVKRMLGGYGADAVAVDSGEKALTRMAENSPDIILSDIGMPGMDGYEFMQALRKNMNSTPAIAITAFARPEDRIRTLQAGYSMHLSKPIDGKELLTVVQAVLRNAGRLR